MRKLAARESLIERPLHREIRDYASKLGFKDLIYLNIGEPDFPTPKPIVEEAVKAMEEGFTHYTSERGIAPLREALAQHLKENRKLDYNPEREILITGGSAEGLFAAVMALVDRGDEVILFTPHYPPYFSSVIAAMGKPVLIEIEEDFNPSPEKTLERINRDKAKLMIINSPCNPTGAVYRKDTLKALAEIAVDYDLYVISDEVYDRFVFEGSHISIASFPGMDERTILVGSFSKTYAMTGWRVGYLAGPENLIGGVLKLKGAINICACSISQRAALAALEKAEPYVAEMLKVYDRRRSLIYEELSRIEGFKVSKPMGAFYIFPNISSLEENSLKFARFLVEKAHVVTSPGVGFGKAGEGHLRISYSASMEALREAVERIRIAVEELGG